MNIAFTIPERGAFDHEGKAIVWADVDGVTTEFVVTKGTETAIGMICLVASKEYTGMTFCHFGDKVNVDLMRKVVIPKVAKFEPAKISPISIPSITMPEMPKIPEIRPVSITIAPMDIRMPNIDASMAEIRTAANDFMETFRKEFGGGE